MDDKEFLTHGSEVLEWMVNYMSTVKDRRVLPQVEPGYLAHLLPDKAPMQGEPWSAVMEDLESKIMPGITHWQHPRFHAYFPAGNNYPSILADMIGGILGCIGFSWIASPAYAELEIVVLDWVAKAIGLPDQFVKSALGSTGGGCLQSSASDGVLVAMLAARHQAIQSIKESDPGETDLHDCHYIPKLVAYTSSQAHSSVEKAAKLALVEIKILETDEKESLRGETLRKEIEQDIKDGRVPFFVCATLGTTGCCSFDNLQEIGEVTKDLPNCWLHVDMAYAGSSFLCPELRHHLQGIENADSATLNPNKLMTISFDCSCFWVRDIKRLTEAMVVDPLYLQHDHQNASIDFRHWGTPLSRRFRSLKLWFTFRSYGIEGLQAYVRNHIKLAKLFESKMRTDPRYEIMNEVELGLVCFRLKTTDQKNEELLASINSSGQLHMIPSMVKGKYIIRFAVTSEKATEEDIDIALDIIKQHTAKVLSEFKAPPPKYRQLSRRFSFTRSISREVYEKRSQRNSLRDGATPIFVPEDNVEEVDDVFSNLSIGECNGE